MAKELELLENTKLRNSHDEQDLGRQSDVRYSIITTVCFD
jgi:hypothetical protein